MKIISETNFYVPPEHIREDSLYLDGSEAKHARGVLRCAVGDVISVTDGRGHEYDVSIKVMREEQIECAILHRRNSPREPNSHITLAQALCRSSTFDLVIEKATELGARSVMPVVTERSLPMPPKGRLENRKTRWRRITIAAMKQSRRSVLPTVEPAVSFETILTLTKDFDLCLLAWEGEKKSGLDYILGDVTKTRKILLLIGPESGFEEKEVERAREASFHPFSIGPRRLRAETASLVSLSLLLYELGDLGPR